MWWGSGGAIEYRIEELIRIDRIDRIDRIEDQSLWILSEKNVANDWGKKSRLEDEGNKGLAILCSSLLIVFQSFFFGFVRFDDKRVEVVEFLSFDDWSVVVISSR